MVLAGRFIKIPCKADICPLSHAAKGVFHAFGGEYRSRLCTFVDDMTVGCPFGQPTVLRSALEYVRLLGRRTCGQNLIHDAVLLGLCGGKDLVAFDIATNVLERTPGVLGKDAFHLFAHALDFGSLNLDV